MSKLNLQTFSNIPAIEVKFDSKETAFHIRSALVQAKKIGTAELGALHFSNIVTLAPRVSADILRGVSDQWADSGKVKMYVSAFNSRPVIHVKDLPDGPTRAMTLSDVIDRYGNDIKQSSLINAYKRVGNLFAGQLAHNFVVLWDVRDAVEVAIVGDAVGASSGARGSRRTGRGGGAWRGSGLGLLEVVWVGVTYLV